MKIIWWAPRSWKTTLSKIISKKTEEKIIHLDDFRMEIYNNLSEKEKQEIFFLFYKVKNYSDFDKKIFKYFEKNKKIISFLRYFWLKTNLEKFLKEFSEERYFEEEFKINEFVTKKFLELEKENLIIEWVSVSPKILENYEIEKENVLFLVKSDVFDILNILEKDPWSFKNRDPKKFSEIILRYWEKIQNEAEKLGFKVIDTSKIDIFKL